MQRRIVLTLLLWLVAAQAAWSGLATADARELKIGYVDAVKVIEQAPQGQAALKRLEIEFAPRDRQIVDMQNQMKTLEQTLDKSGPAMTDADRRAKEFKLIMLRRDVRRATREFEEDYNLRRNEELASLQKIVQKAIIDVARRENYDLVLHQGVIYAGPRVDITNEILRKLGKK